MKSSAKMLAEMEAARIGFDQSKAVFLKYFNNLRRIRVTCSKCPLTLWGHRAHLHLFKQHGMTTVEYHIRLRSELRTIVFNTNAKIAAAKRAEQKALARKIRKLSTTKNPYPSAWKMIMPFKGTYIRHVQGGAVETNRRHH